MLHISSGSASWSLRVSSTQDYPALPDLGDLEWCAVDRNLLRRALDGVRFAVSKDSTKDFIMQVCINNGEVIATDDACFARVTGCVPLDLLCEISSLGVDLLTKMLDRNDATEFRLARTDYHVVAEIGPSHASDRFIVAKLMNPFPLESRTALITPLAENRDILTLDAHELLDVLRRATPTLDEETSAVAVRVGVPQEGSVQIATRNRYGDLSEEVISATFVVDGTDSVASSRTVILNLDSLSKAVKAAVSASPLSDDVDGAGMVQLLLGTPRSRSRVGWVVVQDASRSMQSALSQIRSDWLS
jgi:DNA polymerase III sliding clamp (beta) subunit (PCNA family)